LLFDLTKRYDWTFVFTGVCLVASGLLMLWVPRYQQKKREAAKTTKTTKMARNNGLSK
jgi:ABC-type transporter Mla subunit MlaD